MSKHTPKPPTLEQLMYIRENFRADTMAGQIWRIRDGQCMGTRQLKTGYYVIWVINRLFYRHHLIWFFAKDSWPINTVDHGDRVPGHDWISNLSVSSQQAQMSNISKKSGLPTGVAFVGGRFNPYDAHIYIGGKQQYLGRYPTAEEAYQAYLRRREQLLEVIDAGLVESGEIAATSNPGGEGGTDDADE